MDIKQICDSIFGAIKEDQVRRMRILESIANACGIEKKDMTMEVCKKCASLLEQKEAFVWEYKKNQILIANTGNKLISMPVVPKEFRKLPKGDQRDVENFLDTLGIFSATTIGAGFGLAFDVIKFNNDGDRYVNCPKCNRQNNPQWSDCSCDE